MQVVPQETSKDSSTTKPSYAQILHDKILSAFPIAARIDVADLIPHNVAVPVVLIWHSVFLALLVYYTWQNVKNMQSENFLAPSSSLPTGAICTPVLAPWQAVFNLDSHGRWSTDRRFQANSSIYELSLVGILMPEKDYRLEMEKMYSDFEAMGRATAEQDIPYAVAALASYRYFSPDFQFQFYPNFDVRLLFDRSPSAGMIADSTGKICMANNELTLPTLRYELYTGSMSLTYEKVEDPAGPCGEVFDAFATFGFDIFKTTTFTLRLDVASIYLASAINFGIIKDPANAGLTRVYNNLYSDMGAFYVDEYYQGMTPIFCLHDNNVCFLYYGALFEDQGTFMYPLVGAWTDGGESCPDITSPYGIDNIVGAIFFPSMTPQTIDFGLRVQSMIEADGLSAWISRVRDLMIHVALSSYENTDEGYSTRLASLCESFTCNIAAFEVEWRSIIPPINRNYVMYSHLFNESAQVNSLPCQNVIFQETILQVPIATSPQPLEENYHVCHLTFTEAFQRALGIAVGNAQLYGAIVTAVFVAVVVYWVNRGVKHYLYKVKPISKKHELQEAIMKCLIRSMLDAHESNGSMKHEQVKTLVSLLDIQYGPTQSAQLRDELKQLGIPEAYFTAPPAFAEVLLKKEPDQEKGTAASSW